MLVCAYYPRTQEAEAGTSLASHQGSVSNNNEDDNNHLDMMTHAFNPSGGEAGRSL